MNRSGSARSALSAPLGAPSLARTLVVSARCLSWCTYALVASLPPKGSPHRTAPQPGPAGTRNPAPSAEAGTGPAAQGEHHGTRCNVG